MLTGGVLALQRGGTFREPAGGTGCTFPCPACALPLPPRARVLLPYFLVLLLACQMTCQLGVRTQDLGSLCALASRPFLTLELVASTTITARLTLD